MKYAMRLKGILPKSKEEPLEVIRDGSSNAVFVCELVSWCVAKEQPFKKQGQWLSEVAFELSKRQPIVKFAEKAAQWVRTKTGHKPQAYYVNPCREWDDPVDDELIEGETQMHCRGEGLYLPSDVVPTLRRQGYIKIVEKSQEVLNKQYRESLW